MDDDEVRGKLLGLEAKYAEVPKIPLPHPDLGDWWTLYDYGLEAVSKWPRDYKQPYPGGFFLREKKRA